MQTYATSGPGSSDVVIQGNRCEEIRAQCLMAEGPNDEGGLGEGVSRNWLFDGNYSQVSRLRGGSWPAQGVVIV